MSPELTRAARDLDARLEAAPLADVLRVALERFGANLTIACSLGVEDMVVLHEAAPDRCRSFASCPASFCSIPGGSTRRPTTW